MIGRFYAQNDSRYVMFNLIIVKPIGSAGDIAWQSTTTENILVMARYANASIVTGGHGRMNRL
jgi:hypothetical protein